jgi:hypothetical protein
VNGRPFHKGREQTETTAKIRDATSEFICIQVVTLTAFGIGETVDT